MKRIDIFSNVSWKFIKGFLQFLSMIVIIRAIDIADYGWFVATIAAFELAAVLCVPGVAKIALRSALSSNSRFEQLLGLRIFLLPALFVGFLLVPEIEAAYILLAVASDQISMFARVKLNQHKRYFIYNVLESLKPLMLIITVMAYTLSIGSSLTLSFLIKAYCLLSLLNMMLNLVFARVSSSFKFEVLPPSRDDFVQSLYASGNGLISTCMRRGMVLVAANSLSSVDAAYVNIALQFLTIFTLLYSGFSVSLTRDVYDIRLTLRTIMSVYLQPLLVLTLVIVIGSLFLFFFGEFLLSYILGETALGAAGITYMAPLILFFQLPQLLLMSLFMRMKRELLILIINLLSILIFIPIALVVATSLNNLMYLALAFVTFTSSVYSVTFWVLMRSDRRRLDSFRSDLF